MKSCIYRGVVSHRRFQPTAHRFRYRLFMLYLDLDELDEVFRGRWLWSAKRPSAAWFRRRDHFGDPAVPLSETVRDAVEQATGCRPQGPIRVLTHLRYFGYCFNPISIYYCFDREDRHLDALLAEVTNTPWGERRCYVLDNPSGPEPPDRHRFAKTLHVSPFMPMDLDYLWHSNLPHDTLNVQMDVVRRNERLLDATLALRREEISGASLAGCLGRHPLMTLEVIIGIHWQAVKLWWKRIPIFDHPANAARSDTGTASRSAAENKEI